MSSVILPNPGRSQIETATNIPMFREAFPRLRKVSTTTLEKKAAQFFLRPKPIILEAGGSFRWEATLLSKLGKDSTSFEPFSPCWDAEAHLQNWTPSVPALAPLIKVALPLSAPRPYPNIMPEQPAQSGFSLDNREDLPYRQGLRMPSWGRLQPPEMTGTSILNPHFPFAQVLEDAIEAISRLPLRNLSISSEQMRHLQEYQRSIGPTPDRTNALPIPPINILRALESLQISLHQQWGRQVSSRWMGHLREFITSGYLMHFKANTVPQLKAWETPNLVKKAHAVVNYAKAYWNSVPSIETPLTLLSQEESERRSAESSRSAGVKFLEPLGRRLAQQGIKVFHSNPRVKGSDSYGFPDFYHQMESGPYCQSFAFEHYLGSPCLTPLHMARGVSKFPGSFSPLIQEVTPHLTDINFAAVIAYQKSQIETFLRKNSINPEEMMNWISPYFDMVTFRYDEGERNRIYKPGATGSEGSTKRAVGALAKALDHSSIDRIILEERLNPGEGFGHFLALRRGLSAERKPVWVMLDNLREPRVVDLVQFLQTKRARGAFALHAPRLVMKDPSVQACLQHAIVRSGPLPTQHSRDLGHTQFVTSNLDFLLRAATYIEQEPLLGSLSYGEIFSNLERKLAGAVGGFDPFRISSMKVFRSEVRDLFNAGSLKELGKNIQQRLKEFGAELGQQAILWNKGDTAPALPPLLLKKLQGLQSDLRTVKRVFRSTKKLESLSESADSWKKNQKIRRHAQTLRVKASQEFLNSLKSMAPELKGVADQAADTYNQKKLIQLLDYSERGRLGPSESISLSVFSKKEHDQLSNLRLYRTQIRPDLIKKVNQFLETLKPEENLAFERNEHSLSGFSLKAVTPNHIVWQMEPRCFK